MKKYNIEIVKMLRKNATPMNKFELQDWLDTNLSSDIESTQTLTVDGRGFVAHEVILSDNHGADRRFTVPVLSDDFTFEANGIDTKYGIKSPKTRVGNKNMYILDHKNGCILVSYNVNRHTGGLEKLTIKASVLPHVNRHTGGLENTLLPPHRGKNVNRHTGGLEIEALEALVETEVNRHTGGLERYNNLLDSALFVNRHTGGLETLLHQS